MPSDSSYSHSRRLVTPSHALPLLAPGPSSYFQDPSSSASAGIAPSPFTLDPTSSYAPSFKHSTRLTALLLSSSQGHHEPIPLTMSGKGGGEGYRFPETYNDAEYTKRMRNLKMQGVQGGEDHPAAVQGGDDRWGGEEPWAWSQEEVLLQPHLLSQLAQSEDLLPSEIHPAYPFGRPFPTRPATLHPRASLPKRGTVGGTGSTSRQLMVEAALWNGLIEGNNFGEAGGAGGVGSSGDDPTAACPGGGSDAALSQPLLRLPAYLQTRSALGPASTASSSSWPFTRAGPGRSGWDAILNPRFDHLSRAIKSDQDEDGWLEADLESLFPKGRERHPTLHASQAFPVGDTSTSNGKSKQAPAVLLSSSLAPLVEDQLSSPLGKAFSAAAQGETAAIEAHLSELEAHLVASLSAQEKKGTSLAEEALPEDQRNPEYAASADLRRIMSDAAGVGVGGGGSGSSGSNGGVEGSGVAGGGKKLKSTKKGRGRSSSQTDLLAAYGFGFGSSSSSSPAPGNSHNHNHNHGHGHGHGQSLGRGQGQVDRFGYPCDELATLAIRSASTSAIGADSNASASSSSSASSPSPWSEAALQAEAGDEEGEEDQEVDDPSGGETETETTNRNRNRSRVQGSVQASRPSGGDGSTQSQRQGDDGSATQRQRESATQRERQRAREREREPSQPRREARSAWARMHEEFLRTRTGDGDGDGGGGH
ncbi:hypothetical protein BCV69DRAFT_279931 [Microstroma glucosiphilum]|uniref:Uncharacterized protein n=1 Tax=Pseudomicrostroma glucosiphilum TaxID=1684307 RepID=A0A316UFD7_9BASI|nr:hypothetical protein BCV69DRAFT_279931 [Pseudomicrostroma glucosiphilum]PWN24027.1 hypothetical protein BCV69DRAFT_279931 [Pseudomicrostroma glucosiphilum]